MGAHKLEQLFKKGGDCQTQKEKDKVQIQQYQKAIADKLRDPEFAKKAAMIIEQMLSEKSKSNK